MPSSVIVLWCSVAALCILQSLVCSQQCSQTFEINGTVLRLGACLTLPNGASFAWSHEDGTLLAAYTENTMAATQRWSGWGINPLHPARMSGSAAFLAWRDAAGVAVVKPFQMGRSQNNGKPLTTPGERLFTALNYSAEFGGDTVKIFASVLYSAESLNLVWNSGPVRGGVPVAHDNGNDYENYFSTFSLTSRGPGVAPPGVYPYRQLKFNHAILNAVAWGFLLPVGVIVARYARPFKAPNPTWFYAHIAFQVSGYVLGLAGWAVGLRLRYSVDNRDDKRITHGAIGTVVFSLSTLQVLALVLRPHREHNVRYLWNIYHHTIGYLTILLATTNIFLGFNLFAHVGLDQSSRRKVYVAVLAILAGIAFVLEIFSWSIYLKKKTKKESLTAA